MHDLKVMFPWKDIPVLCDVFKKIDRLFKRSEALDRYQDIKVKPYFRSSSWSVTMSQPIFYKH